MLPIPVFRVEKNANYTTMSNYHLRDNTISFKAKGILSMFLSLPKDWSYSVSGLAAISKEGKDGILSGLKELEAAGYLERHRYRNERGRLGDSEYVIYEIPPHRRPVPATPEQGFPKLEKPTLEKPVLDYPVQDIPVWEKPMQDTPVQEKPAEEKPSQRNTEQERTDRKITDAQIERENGASRHRYGLYRNVLLSDAEFQSLKEQFPGDYSARIDRLSEYMASCGKNYKNHLATIRSWARKDAQRNIDYHHGMYTYKNLFLYTKMQNVAGISTTDAQKSSDMYMKCQYLDEKTGGRGVIFATGTPISNSMTELYTMMRYLQSDTLREKGWSHFDCWAAHFGETKTVIELAPEGTGYRARTRFAKFYNLPELINIWKEAADVKTADQLHLPRPEAVYHNEVAKPTPEQQELVSELSDRAAKVHSGIVEPREDNMLKITSDGRKLGLDQRIINPDLPDEQGTKINMCVENILRIWRDGEAEKLTQLVFCDISTPKAKASPKKSTKEPQEESADAPVFDPLAALNASDSSFTAYQLFGLNLSEQNDPQQTLAGFYEPDSSQIVPVADFLPDIDQALAYATTNNFTQKQIYAFSEAFLRYGTLRKLANVQEALEQQGYTLKIWDAYRPVSAQWALWNAYPDPNYVSNPANSASAHCRGNTVDVTLVKVNGEEVPMPSGFDNFTALADRDYSDCTDEAAANAKLLETIMESNGFRGYQKEWWHYTDTDSYPVEDTFDPAPRSWWLPECDEFISLREAPSVQATVLEKIPVGDRFLMLALDEEYAFVNYNGRYGYVLQSYIKQE